MLQNFPAPQALLPGAFNPWHEAHRGLAQAASQQLGKEVIFELAVKNVDKPPLEEAEVARRLRQFLLALLARTNGCRDVS